MSEWLYDGGVDKINLFNGGVVRPMAVGPSYPVGPTLRFQATLVYSSRVWEFGHTSSRGANSYTPVLGDPALGIGWTFSLGAINEASFSTTRRSPACERRNSCREQDGGFRC